MRTQGPKAAHWNVGARHSMQQKKSPIGAADIDRRRVTGQLDASGREKVTASTQHGIAFGPHSGWHPPVISETFLDLESCCRIKSS
jgi:hypothetical protein